jgi:hypothetical protein
MRKTTTCFVFDPIRSFKFDATHANSVLSYLQRFPLSWNVYKDANTPRSSLDENLVSYP